MPGILRKLALGAGSLVASVVMVVAGTTPAEAYTRYWTCNSGASNSPIYLKNIVTGWNFYLYPGDCTNANNDSGGLRFDPDPDLYGWPDVNRWQEGEIGIGYRNWVDWDPDGGFVNPPDDWQYGSGVRIHTD